MVQIQAPGSEIETRNMFSPHDIVESLVLCGKISCHFVKRFPLNEGGGMACCARHQPTFKLQQICQLGQLILRKIIKIKIVANGSHISKL